jgi:ribosomal protein S18 acetylase RimI-like enzyme
MLIREAKVLDASDIQMINAVSLGYDFSVEQTKKQLQKILHLPGNKIFVAEEDEKVVGYIHIADYESTYAESLKNIMGLAINPTYQNKGIGKRLLLKAEEYAKETGSTGIRLVSGSNRSGAHIFYQRCDYTLRKEQKNFIKIF